MAFYFTTYQLCFVFAEPFTGADVALLLDYSTTPDVIKDLSNFTTPIIDGLDVSPTGVHIALITYGANASVAFPFSALPEYKINRGEIKKLVETARPMNGTPRIDRALQLADRKLFTPEGGARPGVPKVIAFNDYNKICFLKGASL